MIRVQDDKAPSKRMHIYDWTDCFETNIVTIAYQHWWLSLSFYSYMDSTNVTTKGSRIVTRKRISKIHRL